MKLEIGNVLLSSAVAITLLLAGVTQAQTSATAQAAAKGGGTPKPTDAESLALQRERLEVDKEKIASDRLTDGKKLDVERAKVEVEKAKLELEKTKAAWAEIATVVPFLGVLVTLMFSVWSFTRQSRMQVTAQKDAAKLAFEIKAAEIAFEGKSPEAVLNRGNALKAMFADRLDESFLKGFDPNRFGGSKEPPESKQFLLELLVKYPQEKKRILDYWNQLFPGDYEWLQRVKVEDPPASEPAGGADDPDRSVTMIVYGSRRDR